MLTSEVPSPMKGLLRNFASLLSKPQQDNLARIVVGMMATEGEKCVKNVGDSFIPHKDQSNLNRFITDPKWDYHALNKRRIELVEDELGLKGSELCYLLMDDTNVERYGGEGVGYHHDSKHGLIKGHNYVTEVCSVGDVIYPIDLRLYMPEGTSNKPFRNKIELACELIDTFNSPSKQTIVEFDEWYLCGEVVKHVEDRGFDWVSEAKSNRVVFYGDDGQGHGERLHINELAERMRPFYRDVEVDGELYQCLDMDGYLPKIGKTRLLFNCKADTKDIHYSCTNILREKEPSTVAMLKHALKRADIEPFHWDIKNILGFGDYRFRESDAAIIHSHLILLAYSLLLIMKRRIEKREKRERTERKEERRYSIGEACRWVRDRCIVAFCRWIEDKFSQGIRLPNILTMIKPQLRIYK